MTLAKYRSQKRIICSGDAVPGSTDHRIRKEVKTSHLDASSTVERTAEIMITSVVSPSVASEHCASIDEAMTQIETLAAEWSANLWKSAASINITEADHDTVDTIRSFLGQNQLGIPDDKFSHQNGLTSSDDVESSSLHNGDTHLERMCAYCQQTGLERAEGFWYCTICGLAGDKVTDMGAEHRYFGTGTPDLGRCGMPLNPLYPNNNMGTVLYGGRNSYLRKIHFWTSMSHSDSAKYKIYSFLRNRINLAGLSSAIITQAQSYAMHLCDIMIRTEMIRRGNNRRGLIAACLHFSFKKFDCPRSGQEIADILDTPIKVVSAGINTFSEIFLESDLISKYEQTLPSHMIPRFCDQLRCDETIIHQSLELSAQLESTDLLQNHIIEARAAGTIWFVILRNIDSFDKKEKMTRQKVAQVCGISSSTILKCYKKIESAVVLEERESG